MTIWAFKRYEDLGGGGRSVWTEYYSSRESAKAAMERAIDDKVWFLTGGNPGRAKELMSKSVVCEEEFFLLDEGVEIRYSVEPAEVQD